MVFMIFWMRPSKSFSVCFKTVNNSSTSSREHSDSMHSVDLFKIATVSSSDKMAFWAVVETMGVFWLCCVEKSKQTEVS